MSVKVSIIIPVYNVEKYLQDCIDSLLAQTFEDIEFIFINDASPDNCLSILLDNERKHPDKIKVIDSKVNLKQGGARNLGIKAAKGEYIGFVDSDDVIASDMYEKLYRETIKHNIDVVFIKYTAVNENFTIKDADNVKCNSIIEWDQNLLKLNNKPLSDSDRKYLMVTPIGGVVCGLWRKKLLLENELFFPENIRYEDNFWGTIVKCYLTRVSFVNDIGYFYRQNPGSTVHSRNASYNYDRITSEDLLIKYFRDKGLSDKYKEELEYMYVYRRTFNTYYMLTRLYDNIDEDTIISLIKNLNERYPNWYNNCYYKNSTHFRKRLRERFIARFPQIALKIKKYIQCIKRLR